MVSTFSSDRLVPNPPNLIEWINSQGGFVHPAIKIAKTGSHGFGLVASEEIPKGSNLIFLLPHGPLKFDSYRGNAAAAASANSVLLNLSRQIPEEFRAMRLGLKLSKKEELKRIHFGGHISAIFLIPALSPFYFLLNKSRRFLLEFVKSARQMLKDLELDKHPFGGQDVDASSLGWAMSAASSRAYHLKSFNGSVMLPLVDMCNHSFNPNASVLDFTGVLLKGVGEMNIQRGEPLLINYGCMNNDQFLSGFGFVVTSNP